jgi:hypothetical protein
MLHGTYLFTSENRRALALVRVGDTCRPMLLG